jgi:hypothetical protein
MADITNAPAKVLKLGTSTLAKSRDPGFPTDLDIPDVEVP